MLINDGHHEIVEMERAALDRWCKGDPSGFLEICAPDVVYFDPFLDARIDGLDALSSYYDSLRGKICAPRYEIIAPRVQQISDAAILTFRFVSYNDEGEPCRWNCTEVYDYTSGQWRIVQTHWSLTGGGL
ncbi:MAG: DUF4440 domain-containing protein [Capsulimonadaceae bacterium]|nr:DUF4440 domain-containing protein [Capsulimonadaceae bacterium]